MTKIILCGCSGHMGHVVTEIAAADAEVEIVAGIDLSGTKDASYPVFASLKDCDVKADALIDFSSPKALDAILTYCMEKNVPAVLCTAALFGGIFLLTLLSNLRQIQAKRSL